jgi:hypothetical protein
MDVEETETRNDCAGEDQQLFKQIGYSMEK